MYGATENDAGGLYVEHTSALRSPGDKKSGEPMDSPRLRFPALYPSTSSRLIQLLRTEADQKSCSTRADHQLGEYASTAIAGNDILSSLLFVTALTCVEAGIYAPLCQALVVFTLWLYKGVYSEVLSALPMNGGTFNVLLHTVSKTAASVAACFSILSYVSTCVCSGTSAVNYLHELFPDINVIHGTVALLCFFAALNLMGITESAVVALFIFCVHVAVLSLLCVCSLLYVARYGFGTLEANWHGFHTEEPFIPLLGEDGPFRQRGLASSLFYGFGTAMLGVSGFETSSQFIEEQKKGVFPKTLSNMWLTIAIFNPLISLLSLCVFRLPDITAKHRSVLLSAMGYEVAGPWLHWIVSLDAFAVLAGAVLTAFVGVAGLVRRLALERCMPQWLLSENPCRRTPHNIILGFLAVCVSMFLLLGGRVEALSEMYSFCFLVLLLMFAAGHMMMRVKRSQLPRKTVAPIWTVSLAVLLVFVALCSTLEKNPKIIVVFALYFSVTCILVGAMFFRMTLIKFLLRGARAFLKACGGKARQRDAEDAKVDAERAELLRRVAADGAAGVDELELDQVASGGGGCARCASRLQATINRWVRDINSKPIVFFTKRGNVVRMNKAVLYIRQNEDTQYIKVAHFFGPGDMDPAFKQQLIKDVAFLDRLYPKYRIDLVLVKEQFTARGVERLAQYLDVRVNRFFIGCPSRHFGDTVASLGGVRVVTH